LGRGWWGVGGGEEGVSAGSSPETAAGMWVAVLGESTGYKSEKEV